MPTCTTISSSTLHPHLFLLFTSFSSNYIERLETTNILLCNTTKKFQNIFYCELLDLPQWCINLILFWLPLMCQWNSSYLMFGIWSQVVGFQINFGDLRFQNTRCFSISQIFYIFMQVFCPWFGVVISHFVLWAWIPTCFHINYIFNHQQWISKFYAIQKMYCLCMNVFMAITMGSNFACQCHATWFFFLKIVCTNNI
jgi:hypothetical protein